METFKKEERLYNKKVIEYLFANGSSFFIHPFKVVWCEYQLNSQFPASILISASKHNIKKAVIRNRIKRVVREVYRKNKQEFYNFLEERNSKCVFSLIYTAKDVLPYTDLEKKIILILQRLQLEYEKSIE